MAKALTVKELLEPLGLVAEIRLRKNGTVATLQLNLSHHKNISEEIREIVKTLNVRFEKKETSCGFLKYEANLEGVSIFVNTKDCFYGGRPEVIIEKPRTKAYCKKQTKVPQFINEK